MGPGLGAGHEKTDRAAAGCRGPPCANNDGTLPGGGLSRDWGAALWGSVCADQHRSTCR